MAQYGVALWQLSVTYGLVRSFKLSSRSLSCSHLRRFYSLDRASESLWRNTALLLRAACSRTSMYFSRKVRFTLRSVSANAKHMRLLISPLQGIVNALLNGQLVPAPYSQRLELLASTPFLQFGRAFGRTACVLHSFLRLGRAASVNS